MGRRSIRTGSLRRTQPEGTADTAQGRLAVPDTDLLISAVTELTGLVLRSTTDQNTLLTGRTKRARQPGDGRFWRDTAARLPAES